MELKFLLLFLFSNFEIMKFRLRFFRIFKNLPKRFWVFFSTIPRPL